VACILRRHSWMRAVNTAALRRVTASDTAGTCNRIHQATDGPGLSSAVLSQLAPPNQPRQRSQPCRYPLKARLGRRARLRRSGQPPLHFLPPQLITPVQGVQTPPPRLFDATFTMPGTYDTNWAAGRRLRHDARAHARQPPDFGGPRTRRVEPLGCELARLRRHNRLEN
jgi:hypothetical protein